MMNQMWSDLGLSEHGAHSEIWENVMVDRHTLAYPVDLGHIPGHGQTTYITLAPVSVGEI